MRRRFFTALTGLLCLFALGAEVALDPSTAFVRAPAGLDLPVPASGWEAPGPVHAADPASFVVFMVFLRVSPRAEPAVVSYCDPARPSPLRPPIA